MAGDDENPDVSAGNNPEAGGSGQNTAPPTTSAEALTFMAQQLKISQEMNQAMLAEMKSMRKHREEEEERRAEDREKERNHAGRDVKFEPYNNDRPEEWLDWRMTLEKGMLLKTNWSLDEKKKHVQFLMRKNAAHSIANIPLGLGDPTRTLGILLDEYEAQFTAGRGTSSALDELARARQKPEETIHAWAGRYRGLHRRAHPNWADRETSLEFIRKWIMGLYNDEVRNWTLKLPQKTLIEAIETANRAESGAHMDQMVKRSINSINEMHLTSERQGQNMMETEQQRQGLEYMGPNPGPSRRGPPGGCWQCGKDHLVRECKEYQLAMRNHARLRGNNRNNQRQNFQV